jgi:hypothetical protein
LVVSQATTSIQKYSPLMGHYSTKDLLKLALVASRLTKNSERKSKLNTRMTSKPSLGYGLEGGPVVKLMYLYRIGILIRVYAFKIFKLFLFLVRDWSTPCTPLYEFICLSKKKSPIHLELKINSEGHFD